MSSNGSALAVRNDLLPSKDALQTMLTLAGQFVQSGLLPKEINTPQKALVIIQKGVELGIPPMAALNGIAVINGKPACSAELTLALVRRDHGGRAMRVKETTNDTCTVEWREDGWDGNQTYTFTLDDAKRADLLRNQTWQKYPAAMLRARCISAVARMAFPESIAGMYTTEEMNGVVDAGTIIDVMPSAPAPVALVATATVADEPSTTETAIVDGDIIAVETGEIIETTATQPNGNGEKPDDPRQRAMNTLHGAGDDRGLDHTALHRLAFERFGVDSLKVLVGDDLGRLVAWVKAHDTTGWQVINDLIDRIAEARDAETKPAGLAILRETKAAMLRADLLRDTNLAEVYKRTQAFVRDELPDAAPDTNDELPTDGQLANMPAPAVDAGADHWTRT